MLCISELLYMFQNERAFGGQVNEIIYVSPMLTIGSQLISASRVPHAICESDTRGLCVIYDVTFVGERTAHARESRVVNISDNLTFRRSNPSIVAVYAPLRAAIVHRRNHVISPLSMECTVPLLQQPSSSSPRLLLPAKFYFRFRYKLSQSRTTNYHHVGAYRLAIHPK